MIIYNHVNNYQVQKGVGLGQQVEEEGVDLRDSQLLHGELLLGLLKKKNSLFIYLFIYLFSQYS